MPNPWDVGSARLLAAAGFEALATTSAGFAWSLGKPDQSVTREELVAHVRALAAATPLPLNVDSERCYPDDPGGVAGTVRLLADAGAAGFSVEDYDRRRAASTTSKSPPSVSPRPRPPRRRCRSRWS
jgi:2-methylisocitrate lyase-like PEP mutase family enzyme